MTVKNVGHLIPMEAVEQSADVATDWIGSEIDTWKAEEEEYRKKWMTKPLVEKQTIDEKWKERMGGDPRAAESSTKSKL